MKTKRNVITLVCLLAITTAWAKPISESQARSIASAFMARHEMPSSSLKMALKAPKLSAPATGENAAFYAFNASRGGYVIVAGDDRAPAVLGYSDKGTFDPEDVPEAMQELLESYVAQIDALDSGAKAAMHLVNAAPIAPMVKAQWSQNNPYNMKLLFINGKHAHVGCVATAMAQVMYYWKWPARTTCAIPGYTSNTLSIVMPALPVVDFDWNNMHDTYETSDTLSTAAMAAATLSQYCAQAVCMDFKTKSSGAYSSDVPIAMINYFGYQHGTEYVRRMHYTTSTWENMLYEELAAGRPVMYSGSKASGGHAFVCDGYAGNGLFHINWGWNGNSNGYFLLNVLNPDEQGTGGAEGAYGYVYSQAMILGVEPGNKADVLEVTDKYIELESINGNRTTLQQNFTLTQLTHFLNHNSESIGFDYGWALYQGNNRLNILLTGTKDNLDSYYYTKISRTLSFGANISSGTYRIVPIYSEIGANAWKPCIASDINYIEVTINGNNCTATCYGNYCTPDYQLNNISVTGHMHPNRPINITLNVTNKGNTVNDLIYMFANSQFYGAAFVDLEKGASGNVDFMYLSENARPAYLTFSLDEEGNNIIGSQYITLNEMPTATLSGTAYPQNVTDAANRIITSDKFSLNVTVTNNGTATYNEDIIVKLYKHIYGNYGTLVQTQTQTISLDRRQNTSLHFDLDNVMDNWQYFVKVYYYSAGEEVSLCGTGTHTIVFPSSPALPDGDVNGDGEVNIADINAIINIILGGNASPEVRQRADVDKNTEINIADVNAVINIIQKN